MTFLSKNPIPSAGDTMPSKKVHSARFGERSPQALFCVLILALGLSICVSLTMGRATLPLWEVINALCEGALKEPPYASKAETLIYVIRLPRTLLVVLCGGGLAIGGAALQGALRNPLVGPQTIGVLSGAGFGGTLGLLMSISAFLTTGFAFIGGISAMLIVLWIGRSDRQSSPLMLVLSGVVIGALFAAATTILQYTADAERQLPSLVYWLMGSFVSSTASNLQLATGPIVLGSLSLIWMAPKLNALSSGDDEAYSLGLQVELQRVLILLAVSLICAAVVAVAGIIAWIGLVVPHIARSLIGPDHRKLLPISWLIGGGMLLIIDILCRTVTETELPISALTAIIGAPFFIQILRRSHGLGWASN